MRAVKHRPRRSSKHVATCTRVMIARLLRPHSSDHRDEARAASHDREAQGLTATRMPVTHLMIASGPSHGRSPVQPSDVTFGPGSCRFAASCRPPPWSGS